MTIWTVGYNHDGKTVIRSPDGLIVAVVLNTRRALAACGELTRAMNCYSAIKGALGTEEDDDALIEVARNAHRAEQRSATFERLVGTISRMDQRTPSEEAEIDALDTVNRLIEEARNLVK